MASPIVTLTTDWGDRDFFAGMVKGALYSLIPDVRVVDIAHHVEAHNLMAQAFVVRQGCLGFPAQTVHIIDLSVAATDEHPFIAVHYHDQYFLCADNGLPALAFNDGEREVVRIPTRENGIYNFAAYSLFVKTASQLCGGTALTDIGPRHDNLLQRTQSTFLQQESQIRISIHYIDRYGNVYLGMTYREFEELRAGRNFRLMVRDQVVSEFFTSYYQEPARSGPRHRLCLTVSATGLLELAIREQSFAQIMGLRINDEVLLSFA